MIGTKPRRQTRRGNQLQAEQLLWVAAKIARWTSLTPDWSRLSGDEQHAVLGLVEKAAATDEPVDAFNPNVLSRRDLAKLERLVEKAAGEEFAGAFKKDREISELRREVAEIAKETLQSNPILQEEGAFFREVRKQLSHPNGTCLRAEHLAVLTGLLSIVFSGDPPTGSDLRVERGADGETELHWRRGYPFFGVADSNRISSRSEQILLHLCENAWFEVTGGSEMVIRLGKRARRIFRSRR